MTDFKKIYLTTFLFISLLLSGCLPEGKPDPESVTGFQVQQEMYNPRQLQEDFLIFKGVLEEIHPGLYWYHGKQEIDKFFERVERTLVSNNTDLEFYRKLLGIISDIGCGHTWANVPEPMESYLWSEEGNLSLDVRIIDDKLYSLDSYQSDSGSIHAGDQILNINGKPAGLLIEQFMEYTVGDGTIESGRIRMVERRFNFYYTLVYGQPEMYTISYRNRENVTLTIDIPGKTLQDIQQKDTADETEINQGNLLYHFYHDNKTAYLNISAFSDWESNGNEVLFEDEISSFFNRIDMVEVTNLIMDLRDNRGGADDLGLLTLSYLLNQPLVEFKQMYFKSINPYFRGYTDLEDEAVKELPGLTRQINDTTFVLTDLMTTQPFGPSSPSFGGNLYVLINGNTFSTATDVAAILHSRDRATFIGEETGGGYTGNSSGFFITAILPHSKFRVRIPMIRYETNVENNVPNGRGVLPDYPVEPEISAIIDQVDMEMRLTLDLIHNNHQ